MKDIETIILQYLIFDKEYFERVIPYLDYKLFDSFAHKYIAHTIQKYFKEEERPISYEILGLKIQNIENISQENLKLITDVYKKLTDDRNSEIESIIKETEKYFKQRKIWLTISSGIEDYDKLKDFTPDFLNKAEEAISYTFDKSIGYDYMSNASSRLALYQENVIKYPMSVTKLNTFTNGGIEAKTINAVVSSTGGGKSVWLCQEAAYNLKQGRNVLYITLEMSEIQIAKRIDANLLNVKQDDLKKLSQDAFNFRVKQLNQSRLGKLIIKEFPADCITTLDIKNVLDKIIRREKIDIDILIVDYLGIMGSYRYSTRLNNSYTIGKHAAEELRSLAVQYNIPVWTAIQFNRGAENPQDAKAVGMNNVSDSYGIPMGLDFLFSIIHTSEIDKNNKTVFKILKNRYGESKNDSGAFTVLHDWGCARFLDDPNPLNLNNKDDSNTKTGKDIKSAIEKNQNNPIIENKSNTIESNPDINDVFDEL